MENIITSRPMPAIIVSDIDLERLSGLALAAMDRGEIDSRTGADGVIPISDNTGAEVGAIDIDPTTAGYVLSMVGENSSPCDYRLAGEE